MNALPIGSVVFRDPEQLLALGVQPVILKGNVSEHRVRGQHFFVLVHREGMFSVWSPLFSKGDSPFRARVPRTAKRCTLRDRQTKLSWWSNSDSFFDTRQFWISGCDAEFVDSTTIQCEIQAVADRVIPAAREAIRRIWNGR